VDALTAYRWAGPALGFARLKAAAICKALSSLPFHLLLSLFLPSLTFPAATRR